MHDVHKQPLVFLEMDAILAPGEDDAAPGAAQAGAFKVGTVRYPRLVPRDDASAARLKKRTLTNLYNERPACLAACHEKLDAAVAAAYG